MVLVVMTRLTGWWGRAWGSVDGVGTPPVTVVDAVCPEDQVRLGVGAGAPDGLLESVEPILGRVQV